MVMEEAFDSLDAPILRVAGKNATVPFNLELEKASVPSVDEIITAVHAVMGIGYR
jgi:pyruvate dehydrogenase E1 component beta subunit